jgi:hypothetical protein
LSNSGNGAVDGAGQAACISLLIQPVLPEIARCKKYMRKVRGRARGGLKGLSEEAKKAREEGKSLMK